jgi:hypothetical protein
MKKILLPFIFFNLLFSLSGQSQPGNIFRNYFWASPKNNTFCMLRIIGEGNSHEPEKFKNIIHGKYIEHKQITFNHSFGILLQGTAARVMFKNVPVSISETIWKGTEHFKVKLQNSIWYIEKQSGGCSSVIDLKGRDWVNFRKTGDNPPLLSADSDFRGLPNLVFREPGDGTGHPGFDKCTTIQSGENELFVCSKDGKWKFRWIFRAGHAEIKIEKADDSRKYWFLYEGPVAGKFTPGNQYWGTDTDGIRTDCPSIYQNPQEGNWQWAFFGMRNISTTLFVAQKQKDSLPDFFAYMGNDPKKQNLSEDGMNVFGFGRNLNTQPQLSGENHFFIGLFPLPLSQKENMELFEIYINKLLKQQ